MNRLFLLPLAFFAFSCATEELDEDLIDNSRTETVYRQRMRDFVIGISQSAKTVNPDFAIIPQNGIELVSIGGTNPATDYLDAIDGNGQEDLFYGYDSDNQATSSSKTAYLKNLLNISKSSGKTILVTDYCYSPNKIADSDAKNADAGYLSYAAIERQLNVIPDIAPHQVNSENIQNLAQAKNFLFLIDTDTFASKADFVAQVSQTNYDVVIMDLFFENQIFTASEIAQMKHKANGGERMLVCYMSIGEAENYRYYWNPSWTNSHPSWMERENPDWPGNYKVKYWDTTWQNIVYGNSDSYLTKILNAGFDGVYLDIIDAFEYFED